MGQQKRNPKLARVHRKRPRHVAPRLKLRFEDHNYKTIDWSIGGFRIGGFHRPVLPRDTLEGGVVTWGGLKKEAFKAVVVRLTHEDNVCCSFLTLPWAMLKKL